MSRGYDARRKRKRQEARAAAESQRQPRRAWPGRWVAFLPALIIVAILATVGALGLGASNGVSKEQVEKEINALLDGIPQDGSVLGSPKAPITLIVYGDLECPTVRLWVENYLPSFIDKWVRTGAVNLDYRSLETDTTDEEVFFKQEVAALAAGRQDKMWNFLLTFVREQGEPQSNYVTEAFIGAVASQVPDLNPAKWSSDRADARLTKRVALGVFSGHSQGLQSTPSFLLSFTEGEVDRRGERSALRQELETSLRGELASLLTEASEDFPTLRTIGAGLLGG